MNAKPEEKEDFEKKAEEARAKFEALNELEKKIHDRTRNSCAGSKRS